MTMDLCHSSLEQYSHYNLGKQYPTPETAGIVIAEDDAGTRRRLEFTLTKNQWEVVSTADGTEALNVMKRKDRLWLAILDVVMPRMDGIEVCQRIRNINYSVPPYLI